MLLLYILQNHLFSNWHFSCLDQTIFLNFVFAISTYPKFNNWHTFSWITTDLVSFRGHQTLHCFEAFWVALASKGLQHFGLALRQFLEHMNLAYLQWKRIHWAFIWHQNPQNIITDFPAYSDTVYSDTLLTVTLLANPTFLWSVTVSRYLLTVTLCPCPEGVTVSGDLCSHNVIPTSRNVSLYA